MLFGLLLTLHTVRAQVIFKGRILDSVTQQALYPVSVENLRTHQGVLSEKGGRFELPVSVGDYLLFKHVGYGNKVVQVKFGDENKYHTVVMNMKAVLLKGATVRKGPSDYQLDSMNRASIYEDVIGYEQQKSMFTPVTSVYQKFSKKHKQLRKFQNQIARTEEEKFIDSRYTPELVNALTHLEDDEMMKFMKTYPMAYDYARAASDLEIKMWILYNFREYQGKAKAQTIR